MPGRKLTHLDPKGGKKTIAALLALKLSPNALGTFYFAYRGARKTPFLAVLPYRLDRRARQVMDALTPEVRAAFGLGDQVLAARGYVRPGKAADGEEKVVFHAIVDLPLGPGAQRASEVRFAEEIKHTTRTYEELQRYVGQVGVRHEKLADFAARVEEMKNVADEQRDRRRVEKAFGELTADDRDVLARAGFDEAHIEALERKRSDLRLLTENPRWVLDADALAQDLRERWGRLVAALERKVPAQPDADDLAAWQAFGQPVLAEAEELFGRLQATQAETTRMEEARASLAVDVPPAQAAATVPDVVGQRVGEVVLDPALGLQLQRAGDQQGWDRIVAQSPPAGRPLPATGVLLVTGSQFPGMGPELLRTFGAAQVEMVLGTVGVLVAADADRSSGESLLVDALDLPPGWSAWEREDGHYPVGVPLVSRGVAPAAEAGVDAAAVPDAAPEPPARTVGDAWTELDRVARDSRLSDWPEASGSPLLRRLREFERDAPGVSRDDDAERIAAYDALRDAIEGARGAVLASTLERLDTLATALRPHLDAARQGNQGILPARLQRAASIEADAFVTGLQQARARAPAWPGTWDRWKPELDRLVPLTNTVVSHKWLGQMIEDVSQGAFTRQNEDRPYLDQHDSPGVCLAMALRWLGEGWPPKTPGQPTEMQITQADLMAQNQVDLDQQALERTVAEVFRHPDLPVELRSEWDNLVVADERAHTVEKRAPRERTAEQRDRLREAVAERTAALAAIEAYGHASALQVAAKVRGFLRRRLRGARDQEGWSAGPFKISAALQRRLQVEVGFQDAWSAGESDLDGIPMDRARRLMGEAIAQAQGDGTWRFLLSAQGGGSGHAMAFQVRRQGAQLQTRFFDPNLGAFEHGSRGAFEAWFANWHQTANAVTYTDLTLDLVR